MGRGRGYDASVGRAPGLTADLGIRVAGEDRCLTSLRRGARMMGVAGIVMLACGLFMIIIWFTYRATGAPIGVTFVGLGVAFFAVSGVMARKCGGGRGREPDPRPAGTAPKEPRQNNLPRLCGAGPMPSLCRIRPASNGSPPSTRPSPGSWTSGCLGSGPPPKRRPTAGAACVR